MTTLLKYLFVAALYPLAMPWVILWFPAFGDWWIETYAHYIGFVMQLVGVH